MDIPAGDDLQASPVDCFPLVVIYHVIGQQALPYAVIVKFYFFLGPADILICFPVLYGVPILRFYAF